MKDLRISLNTQTKEQLEKSIRSPKSSQAFVFRARIILDIAHGYFVSEVADRLVTIPKTVRKWCHCWQERKGTPEERLQDAYRCGGPPVYPPEDFVEVIEMACQRPSKYGLPISHWTAGELREQLLKERKDDRPVMSVRHIQRNLEEAEIKPHKSCYWLFPKEDEQCEEKIKEVCATYLEAPVVAEEEGIVTISVDEKTGIQALEREIREVAKPGQKQQIEFEYTRHGTTCLFAGFNVVTGEVSGKCNATRNEQDFAAYIKELTDANKGATQIRIVTDNLNTHMSESLVRLTAKLNGEEIELGIKGKEGILKSMETRRVYLNRKNSWLRFIYTPKHRSWLNQVEIWFSILVKKLLKRSSFKSVEELEAEIANFISYFNERLARPFKWTYTGKPLRA